MRSGPRQTKTYGRLSLINLTSLTNTQTGCLITGIVLSRIAPGMCRGFVPPSLIRVHEMLVLVVLCGGVGTLCVKRCLGTKCTRGMTPSQTHKYHPMRSQTYYRMTNQDAVMLWSPVTLYPSHQSSLARNGYNLELRTIHHLFCKPRADTRTIFFVQNAHALMIIPQQTLDNHTNFALP